MIDSILIRCPEVTVQCSVNMEQGNHIPKGELRTVVIPGDIISKFLEVSRDNSEDNVETLGTFGGQIGRDNKFRVTHLLIPRQTGKSDSCTMDGIEDVLEIYQNESLIFLGWIHTHPAYSVFLSSVDMHNQYEWQHMLPEVNPL